VAVLGVGNVALDVARVLARPADDLLASDIPQEVYEQLRASALEDVHVFGRRGPAHVRFTPMELRELGEVAGVDVVLDPAELELDPAAARLVAQDRTARHAVEGLAHLAGRPLTGAPRRVHLHLHQAPVAVLGTRRVEGLRTERTALDEQGRLQGTGATTDWAVQAVYRAVGYTGTPVPGLPFDAARGVVPNAAGRVLDAEGAPVPGTYVNGWIKRGPSGLIGASRKDARETVASLVADATAGALPQAPHPEPEAVLAHLAARGTDVVDLTAWGRIDAHEVLRGAPHGRSRVKVVDREEMLAAARAAEEAASGRGPAPRPPPLTAP
jgi:ferredoxin--NADP+ reductase